MRARHKLVAILLTTSVVFSAVARAEPQELPIWPGVPPGSETWIWDEVKSTDTEGASPPVRIVRNVVRPTLIPYLPDPANASGTAVIIAPGGGFALALDGDEGSRIAEWLAKRGVAAFVLKYRLVHTAADPKDFDHEMKAVSERIQRTAKEHPGQVKTPVELRESTEWAIADGRQAVRYLRVHARDLNIAPDRIGLIGFSFGTGVSMGVVLHHDADSAPNFSAVVYGGGCIDGCPVPQEAPPIFAAVAQDDVYTFAAVKKLFDDWSAAGRSIEFHSFSKGGHGLSGVHWMEPFGHWLESLGLMSPGDRTRN